MIWLCLGPVAMAVGLTMLGCAVYHRRSVRRMVARLEVQEALILGRLGTITGQLGTIAGQHGTNAEQHGTKEPADHGRPQPVDSDDDDFAGFDRDVAIIRKSLSQREEAFRTIAQILEAKDVAKVKWAEDGFPLEIAIPVEGIVPGKKMCRILSRQKIKLDPSDLAAEQSTDPTRNSGNGPVE